MGDQHLMLSHNNAESSTNSSQISNTCRTPACHASAPPGLSSAAVHLEIDPSRGTPESYVAAFFILLTAGVMAVFFLMVILELLDQAVNPRDPEHHRQVKLARQLQAHPEGRRLLQRMTVHQRLQHWGLVIPFALLVLTGMPLKFAEAHWSTLTVGLFGGLTIVRTIHHISGVTLLAIFFYHLIYLLVLLVSQVRRERRGGVHRPIWKFGLDFPLMFSPRDAVEFAQLMAHLVRLRKERPRFGRFNFNEKFEYWAVFWGMPVMGLSGLALWSTPFIAEHFTGRALNFAFIIHSDEAYLAFIYIAAIHLFTVIFSPAVFPISTGTITGQAPPGELVDCHYEQLESVAKRLGIEAPPIEHRRNLVDIFKGLLWRGYSVLVAGGYCALAYFSLRFLILILATRQTAPVEIVDIPKRLEPDVFLASATQAQLQQDAAERPRGPLAHFHQIPQWFQPDPGNTCTTAGCHFALPHGARIEVRAFLNMHATFVDCVVCHTTEPSENTQARWFSLADRQPTRVPAILRLAKRLEELGQVAPDDAEAVSQELQRLLREAMPAAGGAGQFQDWLVRLETTHPRNRAWNDIVDEMRREIHMHEHGEYGAKIGLYKDGRRIGKLSPERRREIHDFLERSKTHAERTSPLATEEFCRQIAPVGAMCTPCHSAEPTLVDLKKLGYSPVRVEQLSNSAILRSILSVEQGQPFYLPLDSKAQEQEQ